MLTYAELRNDEFPFGLNCTPPADLVGGFVVGSLAAGREVVQAERLFTALHELDDRIDTDREAYATVYQYPHRDYTEHVREIGSPKGYAGSAACCRLLWDIDRASDPEAALRDARTLARFVIDRYGESGFGVYFSGSKGYHLSLVAPCGFHPLPHMPDTVKRLCLTVARHASVSVDAAIYDRQRLFRLPNSRHPKTGLYKRFLDAEELFRLEAERIRELARHPAGFTVPRTDELNANLEQDWLVAEARILANPSTGFGSTTLRHVAPSSCPVVPRFVRDFIGFGDVQDPGRAVTLFRCAAALAEAAATHGIPATIRGLLEETAVKTGIDPAEMAKQLAAGITHGERKGKGVSA